VIRDSVESRAKTQKYNILDIISVLYKIGEVVSRDVFVIQVELEIERDKQFRKYN
jgi:hypothetical protein